MNRPFKFRVWDKKRDWWINTQDGLNFRNPDMRFEFAVSTFINLDHCIVQQFTGYLDKNNKEIYEGDIVCLDKDNVFATIFNAEKAEYTSGLVKWLGGGFDVCQRFLGATPIRDFSSCDCCPVWLEVIGNIFENKHLI